MTRIAGPTGGERPTGTSIGNGVPVVLYTRMWRSGTGLYAQGLAQGLAAAGALVTFIAPPGEPDDPAAATANVRRIRPRREYTEAEPAPRLRRAARSLRRVAGGLWALAAQGLAKRRVVVTIADPMAFALWPLLLLRLAGARIVFICHDPLPHAWRLPPALRGVERAFHSASYRVATDVVVLARSAKAALIGEFGLAPAKIAVVPHGAFAPPDAGPIPGTRTLLLFGTVRRNKQVTAAIAGVAAARARGCDVRLIVAGGPDANDAGYVEECRRLAREAGDAITLEIGYVADARVEALFRECDALLLPYADFESQSGVAVLAGLAGRPVIAAMAGGIPDLVADGLATVAIAPPVGASEIADAIAAFQAVPIETWSARAAAGRLSLAQALAWPAVGRMLIDILTRDTPPTRTATGE